jgi:hypothetical protein
MDGKEMLACVAIAGVVVLDAIALLKGIDGLTTLAVVGVLSGLGGVIVGAKSCESK